MAKKKIGVLFGMEDTFPWALVDAINERGGSDVEAAPVKISAIHDNAAPAYDLVLDRISHEVPFYRTWLKCEAAKGTIVVNNPYWWSADDKFFDNIVAERAGVAVPKTVLLPHKQHPPNTTSQSFRNMDLVDWDAVFNYLGWPIFMKPAYGGGWKDVYKCHSPEEFYSAYDQTRDLAMMAQEAIEFTEYYRCYVLGRKRVRIMQYEPRNPFHERYVRNDVDSDTPLTKRIHRDAITLCEILGYDMNTVEFAVRDGVPYAIDFMNCAPDADRFSVGEENFEWMVRNMAEVLIEKVRARRSFELTGTWPEVMRLRSASAMHDVRIPEITVDPAVVPKQPTIVGKEKKPAPSAKTVRAPETKKAKTPKPKT